MRAPRKIVLTSVLAWATLLALNAAADPSAEPPPDVSCRRNNGTGNYQASGRPTGTDIRISGAGGSYSGDATIAFGSGAATPKMKFHFAGLRTLETFTLTSGRRSFQGKLGWGAGRSVAHFDKSGKPVSSAALAALTLTMEVNKAGDVEVRVSATRSVELGKEVRINWVLQPPANIFGKGGEIDKEERRSRRE